ncbi:MAG: hypothetical protein UX04_C0007G0028 [Microgenomates group bacterium GW2011_GWF2_45_18]|nr:MAG: hypothetical protein UW18_C0002G0124 [Microgenomates group bacterium GW2011_GWF1_44_10]KKU01439.1 MAG: hypothetical protein UX04_C0007G0028 [Microgenomates group bacterium GW2011_GWF2_45_18]OGJ41515.1 MAG: hypothetical protein A2378_00530 [Candidatus Pacebacteria bacterium RIFOXYB1_FULL_44_10]HAU98845.1 AbrB family transcriptional regulator [Candidatus Paceibacterota bacterium]HAX01197.1 AbrB family transcriptional regulator [Candidatus Paceibacterota bacterium]
MMYAFTIKKKGQIVIPKAFRDQLNIKENDRVLLSVVKNKIIIERIPTVDEMVGFFKVKKIFTDAEIEEKRAEYLGKKYGRH